MDNTRRFEDGISKNGVCQGHDCRVRPTETSWRAQVSLSATSPDVVPGSWLRVFGVELTRRRSAVYFFEPAEFFPGAISMLTVPSTL